MIVIENVKQSQLNALLTQLQESGQAQIKANDPTSGSITAHHFLMPTINASYWLGGNGELTVESNIFEDRIKAELSERLAALQAQGV